MASEIHSATSGQARNCLNCKEDFTIESEDFDFYAKIKVPPPTWCPECRRIRRMVWRNERALYKRPCDYCQKNIVSMYPKGTSFPVYCKECWYSDNWEATLYGMEYDFNRSFFSQYFELQNKVPRVALFQRSVVNSEFANLIGECKNVYLSISVVLGSENIYYSKGVDASFNIFDSYNVVNSDGCYEVIEGEKNYNSQYLTLSKNCINSFYLFDCANCSNCILSSGLRNKEYYVRNVQYTKDEYAKELSNLRLESRNTRQALSEEFKVLQKKTVRRFANIFRSVDSTGNNLTNVKKCKNCFDVHDAENGKNCYRAFNFSENVDTDYAGKSELLYEYTTGAKDDFRVKFSTCALENVSDAEYTDSLISCSNAFGCIGLRKKEYTILNKEYNKEEYKMLRQKIIEQMEKLPYVDKQGIQYGYGEFFPIELSPFAYNETAAQDFSALDEADAIKRGYRWQNELDKDIKISIKHNDIPDNIKDVSENICNEVLECEHQADCNHRCSIGFKITLEELQYYTKNQIPLPTKCSNCRFYERYKLTLPAQTWHRSCMCKEGSHGHSSTTCPNEFETSYSPDRPEKVYCESCYQKEVL